MNKEDIKKTLQAAKKNSAKRNFNQSIDLNVVLKGIDIKKSDQNVNSFVTLHYQTGKKVSVCALVGPELKAQAEEVCDHTITDGDFGKYQNKKDAKKLARKYDFFIAQATIMPKIATAFGRVFGPKGKMPNPKAGCVVPPNANLKPLYEKLQKTVRLQTKNQPIVQTRVGIEDQAENEVVDNIFTVYDNLSHNLPNGEQNIKKSLIKLTMGKSYRIGEVIKEDKPEKTDSTKK